MKLLLYAAKAANLRVEVIWGLWWREGDIGVRNGIETLYACNTSTVNNFVNNDILITTDFLKGKKDLRKALS